MLRTYKTSSGNAATSGAIALRKDRRMFRDDFENKAVQERDTSSTPTQALPNSNSLPPRNMCTENLNSRVMRLLLLDRSELSVALW